MVQVTPEDHRNIFFWLYKEVKAAKQEERNSARHLRPLLVP